MWYSYPMKVLPQDNQWLYGSIIVSAIFTYVMWFFGEAFLNVTLGVDQGALWYYWKLPEKMFWPRFTAWAGFIAHQLLAWWILYKAQHDRKRYNHSLYRWNYAMLATHAVFTLLHLVHTHIWYDGLAQDTPVWSSQASVIIMLVLVLIMLNDQRGLFFGKSVPMPKVVVQWLKRYHGYIFMVAIVFTFWFHPMETTLAHIIGFFYMFLLMIQSSMMFTKVHVNLVWIFVLEILVLFHGTTVTFTQGNGLWPLFAFGFGLLAVVTQIYNFKLQQKWNWLIQGVYVLAVLIVYSGLIPSTRTFSQIDEVFRIGVIEYGLVLVFLLMLWPPLVAYYKLKNRWASKSVFDCCSE